ncbi:MAG: fimbrial chaperone protein [Sphingomonadales bacterium]|jgi:fimbrial chaperone protein|nr:fimbrial chaperone protein [Sphingomonadales bacterium]
MIGRIIGGGRAAAALCAAAWLGAAGAPAVAGSFRVDPVNIVLPHGRASAELRLTNVDALPVAVRVTALRWTQRGGEDVHEATSDVIASPPIFRVEPGGTQLVRFGLRHRVPGAAYRIHVEEIPQAVAGGTGIRVALRIDLPLYIGAERTTPAHLVWTLERGADGALLAQARNQGGTHAQVSRVEALDAAGRSVGLSSERGAVLPGSMRSWRLGRASGNAETIVVTTPAGALRIPVGGTRP